MEKGRSLKSPILGEYAAPAAAISFLGTGMKFVAIIDGKKKGPDRITSFIYPDNGPLPSVVNPEKPEEAKDGGIPVEEEKQGKTRQG